MEYINIHSHYASFHSNEWVLENVALQNFTMSEHTVSVGLHPWDISLFESMDIENLMEKAFISPQVIAIGECGFDKNIPVTLEKQLEVFEKHVQFSEELQKPLIIHLVGFYSEFLTIKKKYQPKQPWLVHGFQKKEALAKQLTDAGCILSFGKALLQKESLKNVLLQLQNSMFFLETDAATDVRIEEIYQVAASIMGISEKQLMHRMIQHKNEFFNRS